jgi:hypothetical protein
MLRCPKCSASAVFYAAQCEDGFYWRCGSCQHQFKAIRPESDMGRKKQVKEDASRPLEIVLQFDLDKAPFVWGPLTPTGMGTLERYELALLLARSKQAKVNPTDDARTMENLVMFAVRNAKLSKCVPKHVQDVIDKEAEDTAKHQPVQGVVPESVVASDPQHRSEVVEYDEDFYGGIFP